MKALILFCKSRPIKDAQRFFPPAKIGNLKDQEKIRAKQAEHLATLIEEAPTHSLYGEPTEVSICVATLSEDDRSGSMAGAAVNLSFDSMGADEGFNVLGSPSNQLFGPQGRPKTLRRPTVFGEIQTCALPNDLSGLHHALAAVTDVRMIIGPHPTIHSRLLQNAFIRNKLVVPDCLGRKVERLNVFDLLCTRAEGEYPECLAPLGIRQDNPVSDTIQVASLLGVL
jgi:hypothetical protein